MADPDDQKGKRRVVGMALMGSAVMMGLVALLAYSGVFEVTGGAERTIAMVLGGVAVVDFAMALYFLTSNPS
jgi:hypothetical protein